MTTLWGAKEDAMLQMPRVALLVLSVAGLVAGPLSALAGTQTLKARFTERAVVIDGVLEPAEWSRAIPVHVTASGSGSPPGLVPSWVSPPDNQDDSSFKISALYDADNLYVAVQVADDILMHDGPAPWADDDVEIFVDGDRRPGDVDAGVFSGQPNLEGFQLITSVGNARLTEPENFPGIVWESAAGAGPRGFVVEIRIRLDSINTHDTSPATGGSPGFRRPQPGDVVGFNVCVGDDDIGGESYNHPNSFIAWDGSSTNWSAFDELAWGNLYLVPARPRPTQVSSAEFEAEGQAGPRLALEGFRPNPTEGVRLVAFTLVDDSPATLEVLDLAGRRVSLREVGGLGAGRHVVALDAGARLAPGAYIMRLTQERRSVCARGVVVR
jgi:cellulose/xylan binding protein with CBM9 domain